MLAALSDIIEANKALEASEIVEWAKSIGAGLKTFAEVVKQGIDTLGQAEDLLDRTAPPSILQPRMPPLRWSEWWHSSEQFLRNHNPLDIGAHADELPPGFDEGAFESRRARAFSSLPGLTINGQQVSRGNPLPIDVVRGGGSGAGANTLLGGPIGSGGTPPTGAGPGSDHGASGGLRARGTPGGGGSGPNVTPQPDGTVQSLAAKYQDRYPHLSSQQCVASATAAAGIGGTVRDWRRGDSVKDTALEPGTPIATFLNPDGTPSNRYAGGGIGTPGGANRDHAAIFLGKTTDGIWVEEQFAGSGGPHVHFYSWNDPRAGEKSAESYYAINDSHGLPAGTNNPHRHPPHALPSRPYTPTPSGGARLSMLAGPQAVASKSTTRNIASLQVKGATAQEIADNLVAALRPELTA
jgi:hypothetical protein